MTENTSLAPSLGVFAGCYVLFTVLVAAGIILVDFQPNSGVNAGILIASALVASYWFSRTHVRRFSKAEAWRMTIYSLILCWIVSTAFFTLFVAIDPGVAAAVGKTLREAGPLVLAAILLIISGVYLLLLFIIYRWLARFVLKAVRS